MDKQDKTGLLMKEKEYVRFEQLLKRAEEEGRLDGTFNCGLCGMKFHSKEEAEDCCRGSVS